MTFSGKSRLYGLIGNPVLHSASPAVMNRAFAMHGLDAAYIPFAVEDLALAAAVEGLRALGACGINVTYPHKEAVLSLINEPSRGVILLQAANTLVFRRKGISAFNTDAPGVGIALETFAGLALQKKKVFIFGGGGAARAAAYGLLEAGAQDINFCIRDLHKGAQLAARFRGLFPEQRILLTHFRAIANKEMERAVRGSDIVINATPVGMDGYDKTSLPVKPDWLTPEITCFDFVYHPRNTEFIKCARAGGAGTLGGLELLVAQAREAFRIWTGKSFALREMLDYISESQNLEWFKQDLQRKASK